MKNLYDEFLKQLIEVNDETKTMEEHDLLCTKLHAWKQGVKDAIGQTFNGDYYYIDKFDSGELKERPLCCGMFLDWNHK